MRPRLWTLLWLATLLAPLAARAQLPPLLRLGAQYVGGSDVPGQSSLRAQVSSYDVNASIPVALGGSTYLLPGFTYHAESVSYEGAPAEFAQIRALHALDGTLLLTTAIADRWRVSIRGAVGLAGDLAAIDSGALRFNAMAMGSYSPGPWFVVGVGASVGIAFGELRPIPLLYLKWRPVRALRIEATVPIAAEVTALLGDRFELGAFSDLSGNDYAIRNAAVRQDATCIARSAECLDHLSTFVVTVGAVARLRLFSTVWLSVSGGPTLWRRFERKGQDSRVLPGGGRDLPGEFAIRSGIVWRLPGT